MSISPLRRTEITKTYGGLIWAGLGIVCAHELSHIIVGKGLNMQYGWHGFSVNGDITKAMYGIIGVYVNEITPWTIAAGLIGSLIWLTVMKRYGPLFRVHMTSQTFWVGLLYAMWISKWDMMLLADEILKLLI